MEAVPGVERTLLRELPSIGHANVGTVPDICSYDVAWQMKSSESSGLDERVQRDNTVSFSACSRRILDLLCDISGASHYGDREWEELRAALARAQYVKKDIPQLLTETFGQAFPDIVFIYDKNSRLSIHLRVEGNENVCIGQEGLLFRAMPQEISQEVLTDAFSVQGNSSRSICNTFLEHPGEEFFQYNELAYERVMQVTGEYASTGTRDNFEEVCRQDMGCTSHF